MWQACREVAKKVLWILRRGHVAGDRMGSEETTSGVVITHQAVIKAGI